MRSSRPGDRPAPPQATYRLEFRHDRMTFHQAAQLVPYLEDLGISHLYASPCLKTRSGSTHGYAVVDYGQLNPELGTPEEYAALAAALARPRHGSALGLRPQPHERGPRGEPLVAECAGERARLTLCRLLRHRLAPGQGRAQAQDPSAGLGRPVRAGAGGGPTEAGVPRRRLLHPLLRDRAPAEPEDSHHHPPPSAGRAESGNAGRKRGSPRAGERDHGPGPPARPPGNQAGARGRAAA